MRRSELANNESTSKARRRLYIVLGIVLGIVIYGIAVEEVGVSLDELTSETRQERLAQNIRNLANPELVTYDFNQVETNVGVFVPCQGEQADSSNEGLTLSPGCGDPGEIITLSGEGFNSFEEGLIQFIPDSEFDIDLPLGRFAADEDGNFSVEIELPDRPSEIAQAVRVVVPERIGTWGNRQEVWTDTNENGIRDDGIVTGDGLTVTVEGVSPEIPAAALLDPTRQVVEFVTTGDEEFIPASGPATGVPADPIGSTENDVTIASIDGSGSTVTVNITAEEGTDLSGWRVSIYDGVDGEVAATESLGDQIELSPRVSEQTILTIEKIIDTVFLALIATTLGLMVALPLSFIAARNLMKDVSTSVIGLGLGLVAVPAGVLLGMQLVDAQRGFLGNSAREVGAQLLLFAVGAAASFFLARIIFFGREERSSLERIGLSIASLIATSLMLEGFFGLVTAGAGALEEPFGALAFIPGLFTTLGEVGTVILPFLIGLATAFVLIGVSNRAAYWLNAHSSRSFRHLIGFVAMALGGAVVGVILGALVDWLYLIANPTATVYLPALIGAIIGLVIAWLGHRRGEIKIGLSIYYVARTIFNALRSIEPLVMVIVFVVWVGFGEFAGSLALALHTSAALAKLYSEQVESIAAGPMEAVRATGATRLQNTIYAVVPQIVPPYISFTMYRWDINVRMSTILGFAGGGGIGFLLQQNVQLGNYRAASVQMLAIAIVVATMDYASSRLRQRFT